MNTDEFNMKAYEKLFDSKHHYDNLSWLIGGISLAFVGALIAYMPTIKADEYLPQILHRLLPAIFVWVMLAAWHSIYQRNRFWVEAANEAIREFERRYGIRGAGIAFMEAAIKGEVILRNTDESGQEVAGEFTEKLRVGSMHHVIPVVVRLVAVLAAVACVTP